MPPTKTGCIHGDTNSCAPTVTKQNTNTSSQLANPKHPTFFESFEAAIERPLKAFERDLTSVERRVTSLF